VRDFEFVGGAEKDLPHAAFLGPCEKRGKKLTRYSRVFAACFGGDEHLAQGDLAGSEVLQRDGADYFPSRQGDPEISGTLLIELGNCGEVGLIASGDRNAKLVMLDPDDERYHLLGELGPERLDRERSHGEWMGRSGRGFRF
jgi:hypothetical protein